ncbi:hypothetical protein ANN_13414 [Periplaneta americana]|uniref:Uncharacterized protein n=1 Tax=Periplaneta americana TaxID=6978 RepID=A0ABQ8TLX3_PERAM|nr:hypothetical protein ANN_13414 [Periplaneta americana]
MTVYVVLDLCGGRLNFVNRRDGSEVHSKTQVFTIRSEIETLARVLGFCEQGLLLRNSRHHLVRSKIAVALRNKGWIVEEEISWLAENGSTRRVDILAYNADTKQGIIVDNTIRFEVECHQSTEVHLEKKSIYEPTVNYFKLKYTLIHVEVFGLLIGARGTIPAFSKNFDGSLLCQHL